ncbi:hypothetical protein JXA12_02150 [Candidatus Woesearchaeota archaeon]|nr:hypothetical protein [Candidatus Woesearchaeota archaeon]
MDEHKLHKQFKDLLTRIIAACDVLIKDDRVTDGMDLDDAPTSIYDHVQSVKKWIQDIFYLDKELLKYDLKEERALKEIEETVSEEQAEEFAKHHRYNQRIDHHAEQLEIFLDLLLSKKKPLQLKTILFNILQNAAAFRVLVNHELTLDEQLKKHFEIIEEIAEEYEKLL